ncbi:MAG: TIR domain-containing protein [Anaerolineae bacterium]
MKVFISFRNVPDEYKMAWEFYHLLKDEWGYDCWIDRLSIDPGFEYEDKIQKGLDEADVIVGLMSPEAIKRKNVLREWEYASHEMNPTMPEGRLLLVRIKECVLTKHESLGKLHFIDYVDRESWALEHLHNSLKRIEQEIQTMPHRLPPPVFIRPRKETSLMDRVHEQWITNVLDKNLAGIESMASDLIPQPELTLRHDTHGERSLASHENILTAYESSGGELLIVGDPGSGKTTCLLQLTEALLKRAQETPTESVPVVVNLSSWVLAIDGKTSKRLAFPNWLADVLNVSYRISTEDALELIKNNRLVLMLDGLDEVQESVVGELITGINKFKEEYLSAQIVICCRTKEYMAIATQLNVANAIEVKLLTEEQICSYLVRQQKLTGLLNAVSQDKSLMELAATPFYLSILAKTYYDGGEPIAMLLNKRVDDRKTFLLEKYALTRFRSGGEHDFDETRRILAFIAHWMQTRRLSVFLLEEMQVHMLPQPYKRIYFAVTRLIMVILFGLPLGLVGGVLLEPHYGETAWTVSAPLLTLCVGALFWMTRERFLSHRVRIAMIAVAVFPVAMIVQYQVPMPTNLLTACIASGLLAGLAWISLRNHIGSMNEDDRDIYPVEAFTLLPGKTLMSLGLLLIGAIIIIGVLRLLSGQNTLIMILAACFVVNALSGGILAGPDSMVVRNVKRPGGGVIRSFRNGMFLLATFSIISAGLGILAGTQLLGFSLEETLPVALAGSLTAGVPVALYYGLLDAINYVVLRVLQVISHSTPLRLVKFLTFTTELELTRQTGRGFLFIHRFLLEYFAKCYRPAGT